MTNVKKIKQDIQEPKAQQQDLTITLKEVENVEEYYDVDASHDVQPVFKKLEFTNIKGFQVGVNIMQILKEDGTTYLLPIDRIFEVSNSFNEVI